MVNIVYERLKNAPTKDTDNFTYADRTMIRKDWASMLPDMNPQPKTNYIVFRRIVGPLLSTVALNLDSRSVPYYKAESYVGVLVKPDDCWFGLIRYSSFEMVHWFMHKELYQEVATRIKQKSWIPVEGLLTLDDIFTGFKRAARETYIYDHENYEQAFMRIATECKSEEKAKDLLEFGDLTARGSAAPALVAAWAGEPEKAKEYWEWGLKVARKDKDKMVDLYGDLVNNPDLLRATARAERIKHKFEYDPYQDIVGVPYKETWSD